MTVSPAARSALMLAGAALSLSGLAGCSSSNDSAASDATPAEPAASTQAPSSDLSASLQWPDGPAEVPLSVCVSIGEHTIQGAGSTADWSVTFDANLLQPGDQGTLQVSQASDMAVTYDADITDLTVQPDGSFTASGQDAGGAGFTLTGTCGISW